MNTTNRKPCLPHFIRYFAAAFALLCLPSTGSAQNWDNDTGNFLWFSATNWSGNVVPSSGSNVSINGLSSALNPVLLTSGSTDIRQLTLASTATNTFLTLTTGTLTISGPGATNIGNSGTATVTINSNSSFQRTADSNINLGNGGRGTVSVASGAVFGTTGNTDARSINIGGDGSTSGVGTLILSGGTANTAGFLTVRSTAGSTGNVSGYGSVNLNRGLDSRFVQNGILTADGGGTDRELIFITTTPNTSADTLVNTIENTTTNGYYATSRGRLTLNRSTRYNGTANTYNWGESQSDGTIDLVNSVRMTMNTSSFQTIQGSLLATDRTDANAAPSGITFIGYWSFGNNAGTSGNVTITDIQFRFDNIAAGVNSPVIYNWNGAAWVALTTTVDGVTFIADYSGSPLSLMFNNTTAQQFALGVVPEPTTWALIGMSGVIMMTFMRRKRATA